MTCHYQELGSASDCSFREGNLLQPIRSTTLIWLATRHQHGIFDVVSQTSFRGETNREISAVFAGFLYLRCFELAGGSISAFFVHHCASSIVIYGKRSFREKSILLEHSRNRRDTKAGIKVLINVKFFNYSLLKQTKMHKTKCLIIL